MGQPLTENVVVPSGRAWKEKYHRRSLPQSQKFLLCRVTPMAMRETDGAGKREKGRKGERVGGRDKGRRRAGGQE